MNLCRRAFAAPALVGALATVAVFVQTAAVAEIRVYSGGVYSGGALNSAVAPLVVSGLA